MGRRVGNGGHCQAAFLRHVAVLRGIQPARPTGLPAGPAGGKGKRRDDFNASHHDRGSATVRPAGAVLLAADQKPKRGEYLRHARCDHHGRLHFSLFRPYVPVPFRGRPADRHHPGPTDTPGHCCSGKIDLASRHSRQRPDRGTSLPGHYLHSRRGFPVHRLPQKTLSPRGPVVPDRGRARLQCVFGRHRFDFGVSGHSSVSQPVHLLRHAPYRNGRPWCDPPSDHRNFLI